MLYSQKHLLYSLLCFLLFLTEVWSQLQLQESAVWNSVGFASVCTFYVLIFSFCIVQRCLLGISNWLKQAFELQKSQFCYLGWSWNVRFYRYTSSEGSICSRGIIHLLTVFSALHAHFNKLELSVLLRCCSYRKIRQLSIYQVDFSLLKGCFLSLTAHLHICAAVISEPLTSHRIPKRMLLLEGWHYVIVQESHRAEKPPSLQSVTPLFSLFDS